MKNNYRPVTAREVYLLTRNGCQAADWGKVYVTPKFDPKRLQSVRFSGEVRLGNFERTFVLSGGVEVQAGIYYAHLHNVTVGNNVYINKIHNYIANYVIGDDSFIENTNLIVCDGQTSFGNGIRVPVMDESGGREVPIFDGLSAHLAYILALYKYREKAINELYKMIDEYAQKQRSTIGHIGKNVFILNCGMIKNVRIGDFAHIGGAATLKNGSINSNENAPVKIGSGVKCTDFIISSGAKVVDCTLVSRCFVGQGCVFDKHYSALDSLFFANCQGMHGEATAIFAGPYTVSHHKSSLLIAGMFSFLNAGSGSNQSNHMYKLGPIHQGVTERGVKTTSDSYLLWPARVGPFTLVMGRHTNNCDISALPFSYLIENASVSYIVPGVNIRSVGTIRDAQKWPKRDNRKDVIKNDFINFNLLSPFTIERMYQAISVLEGLKNEQGKVREYDYQNCKIRATSLNKGIDLYNLAITKFLGNSLISRLGERIYNNIEQIRERLIPTISCGSGMWCDLAGLIMPKSEVHLLLEKIEKGEMSLEQIQQHFALAHTSYYEYEWTWAYEKLLQRWGKKLDEVTLYDIKKLILEWKEAVLKIDNYLYEDAKKEFNILARTAFGIDGDEQEQERDFEAVRGSFDNNPFVIELLDHIKRKEALGNKTIELIDIIGK